MKVSDTHEQRPIPPERLAEAGVWVARLHGDDRDRHLESGFRQWLKAHPLNARAFELTTEVWEDSQNLRRIVPFAHDVPPMKQESTRFTFPAAGIAALAMVLIAIVAAVLYFQREDTATGIGEQRLLALEDGTRIFLNTATRVVVRYDEGIRKVTLKTGEALFDVARRPGWPFVVEVGDRKVEALGTSFVVRHEQDRTAVTLVEGKVAVTSLAPSDADTASMLSPGQRLTFVSGRPSRLDTPPLDKAIAWRRGQVILDDTPLSAAVVEMNRYNSVKLTIEHPQAASLLVNGLFQAGDSMSFANAVAQTYGLQVLERRDRIVMLGLPKVIAPASMKAPSEVFPASQRPLP